MPRYDRSFWHTVGRAVEATVATLAERSRGGKKRNRRVRRAGGGASGTLHPLPGLLAGAGAAVATSLAARWVGARRPSASRLARGALAGAGAAGAVHGLHLLRLARENGAGPPAPARELADELLAGAGRGVVYAALLDPYLPGPPLLRGVLAGTADFVAQPLGGLFSRLQPLSPIRKVPVISVLLETGDAEPHPYVEFLVYGAVLGLLHGTDRRRE